MNISVVIPTLNEAAALPRTLESLHRDGPAEIIVADGGSTDETIEIAEPFARVIRAPRGRAVQQNLGAAAATGDILFFLHADCCPAAGWQGPMRAAAAAPRFVAGCLRMRIDSDWPLYRLIERGGDLRARWLGLPYGDQGIFIRRDTFLSLGGFPPVAFMEDLLFMQQARRHGRVEVLRHPIHISPRRWERTGIIRQTARNWVLTLLAVWGGVHPDRLTRFYPTVR